MYIKKILSICMIGILLISCSTASKNNVTDINNHNVKATIIEIREYYSDLNTGTFLGASTGTAISFYLIVGSSPAVIIPSIIVSGLVGAKLGAKIQQSLMGIKLEYILRDNSNGKIFNIVQDNKNTFSIGQEVIVIFDNNIPQITFKKIS